MSSVFLLIPLALGMLGVAAWAFVWAVRNHQFDDLDSPGSRVLFDDEQLHVSPPQHEPLRHQLPPQARRGQSPPPQLHQPQEQLQRVQSPPQQQAARTPAPGTDAAVARDENKR